VLSKTATHFGGKSPKQLETQSIKLLVEDFLAMAESLVLRLTFVNTWRADPQSGKSTREKPLVNLAL